MLDGKSAPIALFIFKRADHLERTIRSLKQCDGFIGSKVVVFGDGPRGTHEVSDVASTRALAKELLGPNVEFHFSETNLGLSKSVIDGVTAVVARFGRVIAIEDDLEMSPGFLNFVNAALDRYAADPAVFQISGHMFDAPAVARGGSAIFLPFTTTWGWATWRRAWDCFDPLARGWESLSTDRDLRRQFNLGGCYDYASMLEHQMAGRGDSWGIRWYWSVFQQRGLACFPPCSLIRNIGMDGSGTHGRGVLRGFRQRAELDSAGSIQLPAEAAVDQETFHSVKQAIWQQNGGWVGAAADFCRRRLSFLRKIRS